MKQRSKNLKVTRKAYKATKELLKTTTLSQREIAKEVGLSQASVSAIKLAKNYKQYWVWVDKHNEKIKAKRLAKVQAEEPTLLAKKALLVLINYFTKYENKQA